MSLSPPRRRTNGEARTNLLYWCHQCNQMVRLPSTDSPDITCPLCSGQFLSEINLSRPRLVLDFTDPDPSPEARLLEALSLLFDPPIRQFNGRLHDPQAQSPRFRWIQDRERPRPQDGRRLADSDGEIPVRRRTGRRRRRDAEFLEPEILPRPRTWLILPPIDPSDPLELIRRRQNPIPPGVDPRDYYFGPGLGELIDQLTENDRTGAPPAPERAINAIPSVKISESHLKENSYCPVCQEEFELGGDARELPCKHIYHSDCIVPWLRLHNSCPVCRLEVPVPESSDSGEPSDGGGRLRRCLRWWSQIQLASLWPFHRRHRRIRPEAENNELVQGGSLAVFFSSLQILTLICSGFHFKFTLPLSENGGPHFNTTRYSLAVPKIDPKYRRLWAEEHGQPKMEFSNNLFQDLILVLGMQMLYHMLILAFMVKKHSYMDKFISGKLHSIFLLEAIYWASA